MKVISFTEDEEVIKKILKHLGLWDAKPRPPLRVKAPSVRIHFDYSESQVSSPDAFCSDAGYPMDSYVS